MFAPSPQKRLENGLAEVIDPVKSRTRWNNAVAKLNGLTSDGVSVDAAIKVTLESAVKGLKSVTPEKMEAAFEAAKISSKAPTSSSIPRSTTPVTRGATPPKPKKVRREHRQSQESAPRYGFSKWIWWFIVGVMIGAVLGSIPVSILLSAGAPGFAQAIIYMLVTLGMGLIMSFFVGPFIHRRSSANHSAELAHA